MTAKRTKAETTDLAGPMATKSPAKSPADVHNLFWMEIEMADRPILFSGPMVRALIAGTKTQTRRVMNPQPQLLESGCYHVFNKGGGRVGLDESDVGAAAVDYLRIEKGDRLYVRETWTHTGTGVWTIADTWSALDGQVVYQADNAIPGAKYWPSIHMPRRYSRLTLTVTNVRVERLQDINGADAFSEGVSSTDHWRPKDVQDRPFEEKWWDDFTFWSEYPQIAYRELWEAINGPGSWEANPWVAAYTFSVQTGNIDQLQQIAALTQA